MAARHPGRRPEVDPIITSPERESTQFFRRILACGPGQLLGPNAGDPSLSSDSRAGRIEFSFINGGIYNLSSHDGFAFVNVVPTPEPALLLAVALVPFGVAKLRRRRAGHGEMATQSSAGA